MITATRYFQSIGRTCLGMVISELLTPVLARWMSSRAAFLANRLVWQGGNAGRTTNEICGPNSGVLLANYDPALSSWKTCQLSLPGMAPSLLESLPRWGMTQSGALYRLPTPERHTSENAGGAWPTPTASDVKTGGVDRQNLRQVVRMWPTPKASDSVMGMTANCSDRAPEKSTHIQAQVAIAEDWKPGSGLLLNPEWLETLMGFPPGWTAASDGPPEEA